MWSDTEVKMRRKKEKKYLLLFIVTKKKYRIIKNEINLIKSYCVFKWSQIMLYLPLQIQQGLFPSFSERNKLTQSKSK